jgi:hypothetical protein
MFERVVNIAAVAAFLLGAAPAYSQSYKSFMVRTPDGVNISAQEWGNPNGKEIVFIHGFMQSYLSWSKQLHDPELSKQFRMISYDFRGHGGSDKIMDPKLYNNGEAFADELNAVIQAASLKKPVLVGWSYGTRITSGLLDQIRFFKTRGDHFRRRRWHRRPKAFRFRHAPDPQDRHRRLGAEHRGDQSLHPRLL